MISKSYAIAFAFLIFTPFINCSLRVVSPKQLAETYQNNTINYTLPNFGHIPYGKTLMSQAYLANPIKACYNIDPPKNGSTRIVVVERGNCTFVTKVKMAQMMGAKMVVIVDNVEEDSEYITMKDDGFGTSIQIPAVFVSKRDGAKLISALNSSDPNENSVVLSASFTLPKVDSKLKYIFWLTTSNRESFKLVREFLPNYLKLKPFADFEPHYAIYTCTECELNGYQPNSVSPRIKDLCISNGRYCSPDPDGDGPENPAKGKDIVFEDLRQLCIYKHFPDGWWLYMNRFYETCVEVQQYPECSKTVQQRVNINNVVIEECVRTSFNSSGATPNYETDDNAILKKERLTFLDKKVLFWPGVHIQETSYLGNLEADEIMEAICASFSNENSACSSSSESSAENNSKGSQVNVALIVVIVIALVSIFSIGLALLYKRFIKKEISKEMSTQVNEMVSQYIALYENRGNLSKSTVE